MKHLFIGLSLLFTLFGGISFAATIGDCQIFSATGTNFEYLYGSKRNDSYGNIIPKEGMQTALLHLKGYCCSLTNIQNDTLQKICKEDKSNKIFPESFPASQYLFDHLIDVMFRRLDAQENLLYGLLPDTTGEARRKWINEVANKKDGTSPLLISDTYKSYRTSKGNSFPEQRDKGDTAYLVTEERIKTINTSYIGRSLRNKYERVCDLAIHILYNQNFKKETDKGDYAITLPSAYTACENIESNRIANETIYVKSTLLQKGNKLLYDTVRSYLVDYFLKQKLQTLEQRIFNLKTFFFDVNKNVTELIEECT